MPSIVYKLVIGLLVQGNNGTVRIPDVQNEYIGGGRSIAPALHGWGGIADTVSGQCAIVFHHGALEIQFDMFGRPAAFFPEPLLDTQNRIATLNV